MKSVFEKNSLTSPVDRTLPALYKYIPQIHDDVSEMIVLFNGEYAGTVLHVVGNDKTPRYIGEYERGFISCFDETCWNRLPTIESVTLSN